MRLPALLVLGAAIIAMAGCGADASGGEARGAEARGGVPAPSYGGPLEDPAWRDGQALTTVLRPPKPGGEVAAGMPVVVNRGTEPAVLERVSLVRPSRNLRVLGMYTADSRRAYWAGDEYAWPPPASDYPAGSIRRADGTVVPARSGPGGDLGVEILVVIDVPRPGRMTFRAVRVDYRVGGRRHWIEMPNSYAICAPRRLKCPEVPRYRSSHHGD